MYMSYFLLTTMRVAKRMTALRVAYEKQLAELPKGSLRIKERNGKQYYYLTYRRDGKVVSEYIGSDKKAVYELKEQLERRKDIENLLKSIKKELALMSKVLGVSK